MAGAGHLVPMDQPARALDMVVRFIEGEEWGKGEEGEEEEEAGPSMPAVALSVD